MFGRIDFNPSEFNYILDTSSKHLNESLFQILEGGEDSWYVLHNSIRDLATIGKTEIAEEIILQRCQNSSHDFSKVKDSHLELIRAIEQYDYGLWAGSSQSLYKYALAYSNNIETYKPEELFVTIQRSFYLLITTF
mmetsp:Transcript_33638/g.33104  ORF Transcript_33638/g.33104 Transcript_33638/m.33104 type:complete len:136 (+) Transcript_33638:218-625(+)